MAGISSVNLGLYLQKFFENRWGIYVLQGQGDDSHYMAAWCFAALLSKTCQPPRIKKFGAPKYIGTWNRIQTARDEFNKQGHPTLTDVEVLIAEQAAYQLGKTFSAAITGAFNRAPLYISDPTVGAHIWLDHSLGLTMEMIKKDVGLKYNVNIKSSSESRSLVKTLESFVSGLDTRAIVDACLAVLCDPQSCK